MLTKFHGPTLSKAAFGPKSKDDFFLVAMGSLILLMQAGFAFLEAGSIRAKNATNILIKNFTDLCAGKFPYPHVHFSVRCDMLKNDILISASIHEQCNVRFPQDFKTTLFL